MPLRARTLLGPGPSNPYPEAQAALGFPLLGHLDPLFLQVLDELGPLNELSMSEVDRAYQAVRKLRADVIHQGFLF